MSKRRNKLKNPDFLKYINQYDIILCTETWTNKLSDLNIAGYNNVAIHRARRPGAKRDSGGIVVFFRENLAKFIKVRKTTDDCILWIQISKEIVDGSKDILLGTA